MSQCLSEAEVLGYVRSALNPQQQVLFAEHVSSCPGCQARVEMARESSVNINAAAVQQAATQVEVNSPAEGAMRGSSDSHWSDGASQAVVNAPPSAPKVSLDEFLTGLSQSGLLPAAELASVRDRSHSNPATSTLSGLIEWLVKEHKLTRYQANILARGQSGGLVLGNYVILDKLGQGGMGTVFKARHRRMNRLVALKVLPQSLSSVPEAIARFQREVEAAARLQHPNIAAAFDADESNGVHFLVMEYVEGPTLAHYVKQRGALPIAIAVKLAAQAARGLAAAHAQSIVHRDIKPSNIMINRQGIVKVLDMGLAQVRSTDPNLDLTSDVTQTGRVMGTVDYMSPEQARDAKNVDLRADIYSLGCTLFFLATGKPPAPGNSAAEKLLWHQAQPPLALSAVGIASSPRLDAVVLRMMAKQAEDRPLSMHDVAEELERCIDDLPTADSSMLLDGMDLVSEHGASTLYGSNYGQATMHNLGDTVISDAGSASVKRSAKPPASRRMLYFAGLAAALVLALAVIGTPFWLNFGDTPPPKPADGTLIITLDGEPAEVLVDREWRGMTPGDSRQLELKVKPGSLLVQVRRAGYETYEQTVAVRADEPARVVPVMSKVKVVAQPQPSIHASYEKLLNWVFSHGGQVTAVSGVGQRHQLKANSVWPNVPLEIQAIKLDGMGIRDADLAALRDASGLLDLSLADTKITNAAIAHVQSLRELKRLNLSNTGITDDCLEQIARQLNSLTELNLERTAVGNAGMLKINRIASLEKLFLSDTKVTDPGLLQLAKLPALKILTAHGTGLSEPAHAELESALPELRISWDGADVERAVALKLLNKKATLAVLDRLGNKQEGISTVEKLPGGRILIKEANLSTADEFKDEDLKQMSLLSEIESISLAGTKVGKEGLLSLQSMGKLRKLDLGTLNLDPDAVGRLQQVLPNCNIVIRRPADEEFTERVLGVGGQVSVQPAEGGEYKDLVSKKGQLPNNRYALRMVKLDDSAAVNDVFLEKLAELPELEALFLSNTGVTDKCLERIAACKSLKILGLSGTKVTPAGLAALGALKLNQLYLANTEIGSEGIHSVSKLESLDHLSLLGVKLTDNDLTALKRLVRLSWLDLSATPLTDGAIPNLGNLKQLTVLRLYGTSLTDAGLEELRDDLPGCDVKGDEPDTQRLAARWLVEHGGTVSVAVPPARESLNVASVRDLPRDACRVISIDVAELQIQPKELAKHLAVCQNVVSLNLSQTSTSPAAASAPKLSEGDLAFLQKMPALRDLRLTGLGISDRTLDLLKAHAALEVLDLNGNPRITGKGLANLQASAGLKQLLLANTAVEERYLPALEKLPALEALDLAAAPNLSDQCIGTIARLKNLKMLGLRNAKIGDTSAEKLATLSELERLDLESTKITDGGVAKLASLQKLRFIGLANTMVDNDVVDTLATMTQLGTINLTRTKVSPAAIERLRKALPGRAINGPTVAPRDPNNPLGTGAPVGDSAASEQPENGLRVGRVR